MKRNRIIPFCIGLLVCVLSASCGEEPDLPTESPSSAAGDSIWLRVDASSGGETRAEATGAESRVTHLDLFIFDASGNRVHYESIATPAERFSLQVRKSRFAEDAAYDIYVVANSPVEEHLEGIMDYATLKSRTTSSLYVYATGLVDRESVPTTFLMEGSLSGIRLNDRAERARDKELTVRLTRAAAKIVLNLRAGIGADASGAVEYELAYDEGQSPELDILRLPVNIPVETHLVPLSAEELRAFEPRLYTPSSATATGVVYGTWNGKRSATVTLYAYPNDWSQSDTYTGEPRVLIRLPLRSRSAATGDEELYANNYYAVPLNNVPGGSTRLERNRIYTTTVTFNGLGGTEIEHPVDLSGVSFTTEEWVVHDVVVDTDDDPQFLFLTTHSLRMDNRSEDRSVGYSSSSPVTVRIDAVYYYNKFGLRTEEPLDQVTVVPATTAASGFLEVRGPVPDNNAIRHIETTVTNATGQSERLFIEQYPQVYITNSLGYFSYRSDFEYDPGQCTTWIRHDPDYGLFDWWNNNDRTSVELLNASTADWSWGNYRKQRNETLAGSNLFQSKVQTRDSYDASTGLGNLGSYGWPLGGGVTDWNVSWWYTSPVRDNAHVYHVQITSTSDDYVIGRPRMRSYTDPDGTTYTGTDDGSDNQRLVSPSFMIASQLGLVSDGTMIRTMQQAASHCERYVEVVYRDRNDRRDDDQALIYYDDWRLPTEAELRLIGRFQTGSEVMDIVLDRPAYWSAGGEVSGVGSGVSSDGTPMTGTGVRCVRDCYRDTMEGK